ncbi:PGRS repeat-containing protein, partial [Mycolicibacter virginiensis]|uniref:PGRS repeat-containing protein n=1 Tax=Mycolicibacter virginiensis TaxID=1795032 RepID=UPI0033059108
MGAGSTIAAFLAFGMTPLAAPPPAAADVGFDDILDWLGWDGDLHGGISSGDGFSWPADASAWAEQFQTDLWLPLHAQLEDWIASPFGSQVNDVINELLKPFTLPGFCGIICDGADGTAENPDGQGGGLFFGDGGAGWTSTEAGVAGGNGGVAGGLGNGGDGGAGGLGADGGMGGAGGEWMGNGGRGGDGGAAAVVDGVLLAAGDGGAGGGAGHVQDFFGIGAAGNGGDGGNGGAGFNGAAGANSSGAGVNGGNGGAGTAGGKGGAGGAGSLWLGDGGRGGN